MKRVMRLASQTAVVIFSTSSCCMCHTVKRLFCELGVSPHVHEVDEEAMRREMEKSLGKFLGGRKPAVPAVFIGGKLVGGKLVPLLRDAGALWL